jgi:two-component system chemotaxis response regulator CheY
MKQCLVIDDASVIRKVARHILESMRYEVSEAESGQEALERCKAGMPDLVLLDWHLPVISATEFLTSMRGMPGGKRPQVIYCTTENDPIDISRAFAAGADAYLLKPFDRESIEAKVQEVMAAA